MDVKVPTERAIKIPTVHLNGTSKDELLRQIHDAHVAVQAALDALAKARPHGRDYYVQAVEPGAYDAYTLARNESQVREAKLSEVLDELQAIYVGIEQQGRR